MLKSNAQSQQVRFDFDKKLKSAAVKKKVFVNILTYLLTVKNFT